MANFILTAIKEMFSLPYTYMCVFSNISFIYFVLIFIHYKFAYLYSSFTTPHLEQRSTIESSPIRKQLCLKSNGLSRFAAEVPAGPEYKEPSEFILDWILEPNRLPKK